MSFNTPISQLSGNSTFYDWFIKENTEIISKLNQVTVSGVTSGDGVLVNLNTTSGLATLAIGGTSGNITSGLTFSGSVSFTGETAVPNISYKITGITSGTSGYTFGSVITITPTGYTTAIANNPDTAEVVGVLSSRTAAYSILTLSGKIEGDFTTVAGGTLSPGCVYFLDPTVSGNITTTEPSTIGQVSKPVILGIGQTAGIVLPYRGNYLNASTSGGGESGTNRIYISLPSSPTDPRTQGFSAGVFLSYAPDVLTGSTFNQYLVDTGRTAINGWFVSGSKNFAYRLYDFGSPFLNIPTEEDFVVGMVENVSTSGGNVIYQIIARGTSNIIPNSISSYSGDKRGFWCLSGATFNSLGTTGQLVQNSSNIQNNPYAPLYQVGVVTSNSPSSWYVNPRPLTINPTSNFKSTQLPENLTNGLNFAYNGDFSIWQRNTGRSTVYTGTGNTYFADNWVRRMSGLTGVQSLQRNAFSTSQTEVEGYPKYYVSIKALSSLSEPSPASSVYSIGHIIENFNTFHDEPVTVSFYARCALPNYTANVYFSRYNNGSLVSKNIIGTVNLQTAWTKHVINYTTNDDTLATPNNDYIEIGIDLNPLIVEAWNGNVPTSTNTTVDVASFVIYAGTYTSPPHMFIPDSDKLLRSQKFYYQTYIDETAPGTATMLPSDSSQPSLSAFSFTVLPNSLYGIMPLPVLMRDVPSILVYSPLNGVSNELLNVTARNNLRNTGGSIGYNGAVRYTQIGVSTIQTISDKTTVRINLNMGAVPFDVISGHIIADASYPL